MKSRRVFAGVLLLVWIVCACSEASAWWLGGSSQNVPVIEMPPTVPDCLPAAPKIETVIKQSEKPDISGTAACVTPVTNLMGGDPKIGAVVAKYGWGIVKGCWRAWNAPEGEKWSAFIEGYKEATTTTEGEIAGLVGGVIAY